MEGGRICNAHPREIFSKPRVGLMFAEFVANYEPAWRADGRDVNGNHRPQLGRGRCRRNAGSRN